MKIPSPIFDAEPSFTSLETTFDNGNVSISGTFCQFICKIFAPLCFSRESIVLISLPYIAVDKLPSIVIREGRSYPL